MGRYFDKNDSPRFTIIVDLLAFLLVMTFLGMWGYPQYSVWQQRLTGEAELARAESNRKIAIQEANAKKESAAMLAEAEIVRARGVAEANKIIGDSLHSNEAYLKYLWLDTISKQDKQIIYVPTEANLPILEAGKR